MAREVKISERLRELWYSVLRKENCVAAMELLRDCPKLAWQGWKEDREMGGFDSSYSTRRTALHIGARRGCRPLVQRVLEIFREEGSIHSPEPANQECEYVGLGGVGDLLAAKDPHYELDALDMAIFHGNREIISILANASLSCKANPYKILRGFGVLEDPRPDDMHINLLAVQLREITEQVMEDMAAERLKENYMLDCNFNFLPWQEYVFLFTFTFDVTTWATELVHVARLVRNQIFKMATNISQSLRDFLLHLQDGLGRTALHVAVEGDHVLEFLSLIHDHKSCVNVLRDGVGRTALHWAAALGKRKAISQLIRYHWETDLNATFDMDVPLLSLDASWLADRPGFNYRARFSPKSVSPLHLAIIHKHVKCVNVLLNDRSKNGRSLNLSRDSSLPVGNDLVLGPLQMATILGSAPIVRLLLKDGRAQDTYDPGLSRKTLSRLLDDENNFSIIMDMDMDFWPLQSAFHIAASFCNFDLIKVFLDYGHKSNYNLFVRDMDGNTALHHVMLGVYDDYYEHQCFKYEAFKLLFEFVSLEQVVETRDMQQKELDSSRRNQDKSKLAFIERQGCVELLLQAGFNPSIANNDNQAPHPGRDASPEFLSWWFERLAKETIAMQNTLNAAANAISVTAALVATASYGGPLQPPLNYWQNPSDLTTQIHTNDISVRTFIIFDTLSFFFAVAAIMMALIPSIPIPRQSTRIELQRTRMIVNIAIGLLFPSIVFVLIAFAAASIAVIPTDSSWKYGGLTMTTVVVGGLLCLSVIILFSIRILLVVDKNRTIRKFYDKLRF